jgi:glycosyltransferase involved in cell wall biosynthesis
MRVLLVSHQLDFSGAPIALLAAAKVLLKQGHAVQLLAISQGPLAKDFEAAGVRIVPKLDCHDVDRIILNTSVCARLADVIQERVPFILWLHESPQLFLHSDLPYIVSKAAVRARAIIFPSPSVGVDWARYGSLRGSATKCLYARAPVSIPKENVNSCSALSSLTTPIRIISIDPVESFRGHAVIADAIRILHAQGIDIHLTAVGASLAKIQEIFSMLSPDRVLATDRVPRDMVWRYLGGSHVYVSATSFATQNLGLCEASLSGIPAIVSDIPAHRNWAEEMGAGVQIYPLFSATELAKRLIFLKDNYHALKELAAASMSVAYELISHKRFAEVIQEALIS